MVYGGAYTGVGVVPNYGVSDLDIDRSRSYSTSTDRAGTGEQRRDQVRSQHLVWDTQGTDKVKIEVRGVCVVCVRISFSLSVVIRSAWNLPVSCSRECCSM